MSIPASVIVVTRNEQGRIVRCLKALSSFDEVIVVDSQSSDETVALAKSHGAQVVSFVWNGRYPKKRQWCLENIKTRHEWIFFVDADEVVTPVLAAEIEKRLRQDKAGVAGYFVRGRYVMSDKVLRFGVKNNKLCLLHKKRMMFPVIDDLDLPGMGEIEGHYQPVRRDGFADYDILQLEQALLHYAYESRTGWVARHQRYAAWERGMNEKQAWPQDPVFWRQGLKMLFRWLPGRGLVAFLHSYILKAGFLDGKAGFSLAYDRYLYYRMISNPAIAAKLKTRS